MSYVWIDIDNPPQVQYLLPFKRAFENTGHTVVVTARDYGITLELLEQRGVEHQAVGREAGTGRLRKATAAVRRAQALTKTFGRGSRPDLVITASRAAALAGRRLGKPVFTFIDYEFVNLTVPRRTGSYLVFPDLIGDEFFQSNGFKRDRLIGYPGLKEALSFAEIDLGSVTPHDFGASTTGKPLLLFRPPAERAHYFDAESAELSSGLIDRLAKRDDVQVVVTPRYAHQALAIERLEWKSRPIVLDEPVPFAPLLLGVDAVMSSGGTMLREAAYLGIPAFSTFRSAVGAVDKHLAETQRVRFITSPQDLDEIEFAPRGGLATDGDGAVLLDRLVRELSARA
jgi:predicted glycosyltransferase